MKLGQGRCELAQQLRGLALAPSRLSSVTLEKRDTLFGAWTTFSAATKKGKGIGATEQLRVTFFG